MTKQEFEARTLVVVSDAEFEHINEVYMVSDVEKDEFCALWCKMNKNRVNGAKVERRERQMAEAYRDQLRKFFDKYAKDMEKYWTPICYVKLSCYDIQAMSWAGIKMNDRFGDIRYLGSVTYEVGNYLGIYA